MVFNRTFLIFGIILFSGCAISEFNELESEIKPTIGKHETISEALKGLEELGFTCIEGTFHDLKKKDINECTRDQGNFWPPYGCIHRVWLTKANSNSEPFKYEIFKPMCTGL